MGIAYLGDWILKSFTPIPPILIVTIGACLFKLVTTKESKSFADLIPTEKIRGFFYRMIEKLKNIFRCRERE